MEKSYVDKLVTLTSAALSLSHTLPEYLIDQKGSYQIFHKLFLSTFLHVFDSGKTRGYQFRQLCCRTNPGYLA